MCADLVVRQVSIIRALAPKLAQLEGAVALMWLPGQHQKFTDCPRAISGTRPIALTVEVGAQGALTLGISRSRPAAGKMRYGAIMRKDLGRPMTSDGLGTSLAFTNDVIARRAVEMLDKLDAFASRRAVSPRASEFEVPRHPRFLVPCDKGDAVIDAHKLERLAAAKRGGLESVIDAQRRLLRELITRESDGVVLVDASIASDKAIAACIASERGFEDFRPVLGVRRFNPVRKLRELPNPAASLLADRGISDVGSLDQPAVDELVAAVRAAVFMGDRLTQDEVYDALCNPTEPVRCRKGVEGLSDREIVLAMRRVIGKSSVGWDATDEEIIEGIRLLAETEGIFAETAGGVTVACARKLIETGKIPANEEVVLCITGHGLKTVEALAGHLGTPTKIRPTLKDFDALLSSKLVKTAVRH